MSWYRRPKRAPFIDVTEGKGGGTGGGGDIPWLRHLPAAAGGLFLLTAAWSSFYTVPADSEAVVTRFGRFSHVVTPGLRFKLPWGIDEVSKVPVKRQLKVEFGFSTPGSGNTFQSTDADEQTKERRMVTGDLNVALVEWVVQYRINDPRAFTFKVRDPEVTLRDLSESVMRQVVGDRTVDEVITIGRQEIEFEALKEMQRLANLFETGITVDQVQLKDVNPPSEVQASFNEVNQAQQERERAINLAKGQFNKIIPQARGAADQKLSEAEGYATRRVKEAEGDVARFNAVLAEYVKAPEVTRRRLYLETMQEVLPRLGRRYVVDADLKGVLPLLSLDAGPESGARLAPARPPRDVGIPCAPPTPQRIPQAMNRSLRNLAITAVAALLLLWANPFYVVIETEQVIVTQFGRPVGLAVTNAGLHVRVPFIQEVNRIEKRALEWDGDPREMPTKDKTYLVVDAFARWRISDPGAFFLRLRDERSARSRLDDIIGGEIRSVVAAHDLIEIVRSNRERQPVREEAKADGIALQVHWPPIQSGRAALERLVQEASAPKLASFGIELLNVQFTRINYNRAVEQSIYQRMISERQQIAERFRSEGQGEAARILGNREKELQLIESEAYRKVQSVRGDADARASEIYAKAYNQDPAAASFYAFLKTLETWQKAADANTTLVVGTDGDVFGLLKGMNAREGGK